MMTSRLNKLKYRHFYCFDVNRVKSFMIYKMRVNQIVTVFKQCSKEFIELKRIRKKEKKINIIMNLVAFICRRLDLVSLLFWEHMKVIRRRLWVHRLDYCRCCCYDPCNDVLHRSNCRRINWRVTSHIWVVAEMFASRKCFVLSFFVVVVILYAHKIRATFNEIASVRRHTSTSWSPFWPIRNSPIQYEALFDREVT